MGMEVQGRRERNGWTVGGMISERRDCRGRKCSHHKSGAKWLFAENFFSPKIRVYCVSAWVSPGLIFLENHPKIPLNQY